MYTIDQQIQPVASSIEEKNDNNVNILTTEGASSLAMFSLAQIVDDVVQDMRKRGIPAGRWATFVHVRI